MTKSKEPFDFKQRQVQKIYREQLAKKQRREQEKKHVLLFLSFIVFGSLIWAVMEHFLF